MTQKKFLFIDRDGTIIHEPEDQQIDTLEKLHLLPGVISALFKLQAAGFRLVMISNQDGLGTSRFPQQNFEQPQNWLLKLLQSQGITFDAIHICPHFAHDACDCRKPKVGLVLSYLNTQVIDRRHSYVIGDRASDLELARNMGITGLSISQYDPLAWKKITAQILQAPRTAVATRTTQETQIQAEINLDQTTPIQIQTGIGFFDHMLEQLAKHGGFSLALTVQGDLHIDDHHTVEDTALVLGQALRQALGDKYGITRYGFLLPMDEALAQIALDLSGRPYCTFNASLQRDKVGELSTELVPHFFRSFCDSLGATLHIQAQGHNTHHVIEAIFKGVGRTLSQAMTRSSHAIPSTKGVL